MKRFSILITHLSLYLGGGFIRADHLSEYSISKISVSGIFTGKDTFKKLYRLSKGSPFKKAEHDDGLRAIEKYLKDQGYLAARVTGQCASDHKRKTVHVRLAIDTGPLFTIRSVRCDIHDVQDDQEDILKKIRSKLEARLKKAYCTQNLLDAQARMISAYCTKKGYPGVSIEMEQLRFDEHHCVDIHFNCSLHDKKKCSFVGNIQVRSEELYRVCAEFGKSLAIIPPDLLAQELRDLYYKRGYLDVTIDFYDEKSSVIFSIHEGPRARIESVALYGITDNALLKNRYVKKLIGSYYDHKKITETLGAYVTYLMQQGYWKARIQSTQMHKLSADTYELAVTFDLGKRLAIAKIEGEDFEGLLTLLYKQWWCKRYAPLFTGVFKRHGRGQVCADITVIGRMKKFLQKQLHEKGYLYTQVLFEFKEHEGAQVLVWHFNAKQKIFFGDTAIKGSCFVPENIIKRAIAYKKGDVWNKKRLDETAATLRSFGVFDQVTVFPENIGRVENEKDIIIQLQDSDPFELRARAGFQGVGNNFTWRGGATYKFGGTFVWKNPRHCADLFSMDFDINRFLRYAMMMYQLAFLGSLPIRQQFKMYSNRYDQPVVIGSREILYRYAQDGFLWALSQDISGFQWGVTSGIDWLQISDISKTLAQAIDFTTRFVDKRIPYLFCEPSMYVSDVDNRLDPLVGWYVVLSSKAFAPLGVKNAGFIKFLFEQGNYIPLHRQSHTVLAIRLRLGTIIYEQFSAIVPPERFFLGGAYSLRGYEPDLAPPLNFYTNSNNELIVVPTGGKTMMNGNFELRFTIFRSLGGTLFTDIGILTQSSITDIHARDIIGASGFGLRWNTPVGPLRFDIGWKWKKFPGNPPYYDQASYAWFLTLGNAF